MALALWRIHLLNSDPVIPDWMNISKIIVEQKLQNQKYNAKDTVGLADINAKQLFYKKLARTI